MAQEGEEQVRLKGMVADAQSQAPWSLQLFWHQREYAVSAAVLWTGEIDGVQMDKPQEPEEKHELAEIPAIPKMESNTDAEDISLYLYSVTD